MYFNSHILSFRRIILPQTNAVQDHNQKHIWQRQRVDLSNDTRYNTRYKPLTFTLSFVMISLHHESFGCYNMKWNLFDCQCAETWNKHVMSTKHTKGREGAGIVRHFRMKSDVVSGRHGYDSESSHDSTQNKMFFAWVRSRFESKSWKVRKHFESWVH